MSALNDATKKPAAKLIHIEQAWPHRIVSAELNQKATLESSKRGFF